MKSSQLTRILSLVSSVDEFSVNLLPVLLIQDVLLFLASSFFLFILVAWLVRSRPAFIFVVSGIESGNYTLSIWIITRHTNWYSEKENRAYCRRHKIYWWNYLFLILFGLLLGCSKATKATIKGTASLT